MESWSIGHGSATELIRYQIKLERELELQQWYKADVRQRGDYVLWVSGFLFELPGVPSGLTQGHPHSQTLAQAD
jgi:hypothetical protein